MGVNSSGARACFLLPLAILAAAGCSVVQPQGRAEGRSNDPNQSTSLYSKTRNGYVRARNADGTFQPQSYIMEAGTRGKTTESRSYDQLSLEDISGSLRKPLAIQNYVPSDDPADTDLLILVYWGVTLTPDDLHPYGFRGSDFAAGAGGYHGAGMGPRVPESPSWIPTGSAREQAPSFQKVEADEDARTDSGNAAILGYADALLARPPDDRAARALIAELEEHRYYVVLLAYDYRVARAQGIHKLLWETRFSLAEYGNNFPKELPAMAILAAKYLGRDSAGLVHNNLREGRVEIGEPKALDTVP